MLTRCLEALLGMEVVPAEVIIADQSLEDATRQFVAGLSNDVVRLTWMHLEPRGLSAARNLAAERASRPWIAFTDDDCVPVSGWAAGIQQAFTSTPELVAVTGRVLALGPETPGRYPISLRESPVRVDYRRHALPWFVGSGNNFAVRQEWYRRVGGCDVRLGTGSPGRAGEDMDLFHKLLASGGVVRYEPQALVYHEQQDLARRLSSRFDYGFGMGAFCGLRLRLADGYAGYLLARWVAWLSRELVGFTLQRDRFQARQRLLVLSGTARGLAYGITHAGVRE